MNRSTILLGAGLLGMTGVALGAFGAHALRETLRHRDMLDAWETAVRYQLLHAVALVAVAGWGGAAGAVKPRALGWAAGLWIGGTLLFSGSLYGMAFGGPRWLGPVTPVGGLALLVGWICVAVAGLLKSADDAGGSGGQSQTQG